MLVEEEEKVECFFGIYGVYLRVSNILEESLQNWIYKSGPIQVVGFPRLDQPRLRIRGPLKTCYRSLYWVVLLNGENTSNHITLTFASSCLFCIPSNLSLP